jgi:hypothetical protein
LNTCAHYPKPQKVNECHITTRSTATLGKHHSARSLVRVIADVRWHDGGAVQSRSANDRLRPAAVMFWAFVSGH